MAEAKTKLSTPSVLAFEAKLIPSDALMYAGTWGGDEWQAIQVNEKAVRGTISNRLKSAISNDPAKLDAEVSKANLQTVDNAALPLSCDTLRLDFSLRVVGGLNQPTACNSPEYQQALASLISAYEEQHGFTELANRYAQNIANARFFWRNRVGAEELRVDVKVNGEQLSFNPYDFSLRDFSNNEAVDFLQRRQK